MIMEVEILKEALTKPQAKTELAARVAAARHFPIKTTSTYFAWHEPVHRPTALRRHYRKAADEALLPLIRR
jgi:hypothetical protein